MSAEATTGEVYHEMQKLEAESELRSDTSKQPEQDAESLSLQSNRAARRAYQLQTAEEARNASKKTSDAAVSDGHDEIEATSEKAEAKSGKSLLAMKLKMMEADKTALDIEDQDGKIDAIEEARENPQDSDEDDAGDGTGIAERLQEYERRLAQAKQTATQMWH
jgi:hypothetical protein